MSKEIESVNNFLFAANVIAGMGAFLLIGGHAAGLFEVMEPSAYLEMGVDGGAQSLSRPLAMVAIGSPVLAAIVRFAASAKVSAKIQPVLLMGACSCPLLAIQSSFRPLFELLRNLG